MSYEDNSAGRRAKTGTERWPLIAAVVILLVVLLVAIIFGFRIVLHYTDKTIDHLQTTQAQQYASPYGDGYTTPYGAYAPGDVRATTGPDPRTTAPGENDIRSYSPGYDIRSTTPGQPDLRNAEEDPFAQAIEAARAASGQ